MSLFERHFTLDEARAELPRLRKELMDLQREMGNLEATGEGVESAAAHAGQNGGSAAAGLHFTHQARVARLISCIVDRGIQIKDPRRGLVDFPHWRGGEEVLLCWLPEEDDIYYWHDVEAGFQGRRPV